MFVFFMEDEWQVYHENLPIMKVKQMNRLNDAPHVNSFEWKCVLATHEIQT